MTTIAVPDIRPAIVCPSWCTISHEEHRAHLPAWEGFVIHWGARSRLATPTTVTYVDGTPDETAPPMIHLGSVPLGDGLQLDQAEALAYAILVAVQRGAVMSAQTSIEAFSLYGDNGGSVHYERDQDLFITTKSAMRGGDPAALLLVELGIDGYQTHQVRLDFPPVDNSDDPDAFQYNPRAGEVQALTDAIEALTAVRDRLAAMLAT